MPKPRIFLSYRRDDSAQATRNVREQLEQAGHEHVFMDTHEINPGERWYQRIGEELDAADVVLAVIGPMWLSCTDSDHRRRIDNPSDVVHLELRRALEGKKRIVPVLVDRAEMPSPGSLPVGLQELASFQAKRLTSENWDDDVKALVSSLGKSDATKPRATLVLTSTSPRRRELLQSIGWADGKDFFQVHASVTLNDA